MLNPTGCGWCGRTLTGRQKKWCSRKCSREYRANHRWTDAKAAVKKEATWFLCANAEFERGEGGQWGYTTKARGPRGCLGFTQKPEVNHITPIKGKHGTWGCHHHLEGLEVLCRPCHLAETKRQRENGEFK